MANSEKFFNVTVEEYLQMEEASEVRHEYIDGRLYPMISSSYNHNAISLNIATAFRNKLKNSGCTVFINKFKVKIDDINCFYYPDVLIDCGSFDSQSLFTETPSVIVEVLSESTASIDTREKFLNYGKIGSLKDYLIVHQTRMHVDRFSLESNRNWRCQQFLSYEDILTLNVFPSKSIELSMAEIYEDIEFDSKSSLAEQAEFDAVYSW